MIHNYEKIILESHLDSFGHVNNATYLTLFEEARWDWISKNGYGYHKVQELKKGPVILEMQIQFKNELRLREKIRIQTKTIEWQTKIGKLEQSIFNEAGELATFAAMTVGFFDLKERKLIQPSDQWLRAIETIP